MSFKIGDKVRVVKASFENYDEIGLSGVIVKFIEKANTLEMEVLVSTNLPNTDKIFYGYKLSDLVTEEVYNSPLFKLLQEEI